MLDASSPASAAPDWREELVRLLSSPNNSDWDRAQELKLSKMPSHLFRYRGPTKYAIEGLINKSVWLSRASEFNDLFDTSATVDAHRLLNHVSQEDLAEGKLGLPPEVMALLPADAPGFIEAMDAALVKAIEMEHGAETAKKAVGFFTNFTKKQGIEMGTRLSEFTQAATKVACFCEVHDDARMWAFYADDHKGFCVEYPFVALPRDDLRLRWMMPVIYKPEAFSVSDLIMGTGRKPNPFAAYLTAMHKLAKWDYEQEWRMIDAVGDNAPGRQILLPTPSRIFLGHRITDANRTFIEAIAKDQGIGLFEMVPAHEGFRLEARPLENLGAPPPTAPPTQ
jgi:hypothetical protein